MNSRPLLTLHHLQNQPAPITISKPTKSNPKQKPTQTQVSELHARLKPHLLRRIKRDVLKQLPPKMEQIVRVELSVKQREWWVCLGGGC